MGKFGTYPRIVGNDIHDKGCLGAIYIIYIRK